MFMVMKRKYFRSWQKTVTCITSMWCRYGTWHYLHRSLFKDLLCWMKSTNATSVFNLSLDRVNRCVNKNIFQFFLFISVVAPSFGWSFLGWQWDMMRQFWVCYDEVGTYFMRKGRIAVWFWSKTQHRASEVGWSKSRAPQVK
jgi:hypothetical protein